MGGMRFVIAVEFPVKKREQGVRQMGHQNCLTVPTALNRRSRMTLTDMQSDMAGKPSCAQALRNSAFLHQDVRSYAVGLECIAAFSIVLLPQFAKFSNRAGFGPSCARFLMTTS